MCEKLSLGPNIINFEENVCKTFHGGITALKYEPRKVRHICHKRGQEHDRLLVQFYKLYIALVEILSKINEIFYFRPKSNTLSFENSPVGINTLNSFLPNLCKAVGIKRKTADCLRFTCLSKLYNSGVEEKLIRERTGHNSYEKTSERKVSRVSALSGGETKTEKEEEKLNCKGYEEKSSEGFSSFNASSSTNCDVKIFVNEKKITYNVAD